MDAPEKSFRTKTGRCVVHADRLELERSGARGALAWALFGDSLGRARVVYGVLISLLSALTLFEVLARQYDQAFLTGVVALFMVRAVVKSRGLSAAPVVQRSAITRIEANAPRAPVTRGHFVVHFMDQGRSLRRLIILPGAVEGGSAEFERALELLKSEGLPVS